jgi:hypothetical protein
MRPEQVDKLGGQEERSEEGFWSRELCTEACTEMTDEHKRPGASPLFLKELSQLLSEDIRSTV